MSASAGLQAEEKLAEGIDKIRRGLEILQAAADDTGSDEPVAPTA